MKRLSLGKVSLLVLVLCFALPLIYAQQPVNRNPLTPIETFANLGIDVKEAALPPLARSRSALVDNLGVLRGFQVYNPTTGVGAITLTYAPLPGYNNKTAVQALIAEENKTLPLLRRVFQTTRAEIVRTVTTWDNNNARNSYYRAIPNGEGNTIFTLLSSIGNLINTNLAVNTFMTGISESIRTDFYVRTSIELRKFNASANVTRSANRPNARSNVTADIVFTIALITAEKYNASELNMFEWRDFTDSSPVAQFKDIVQNDFMRFGSQADPAIDFVLIVDNSYSMDDYQRSVSDAAGILRTRLGIAGLTNFRIGLLTSSFYNTQCWPNRNNLVCDQNRNTSCRPFAQTNRLESLGSWLTPNTSSWIGAGTTACQTGTEKALLSLKQVLSITPDHASFLPVTGVFQAVNPQKLRQGSNLVFIFIGDADDQSYGSGLEGSLGTCRQGINNYTNFLRTFRSSNRFASITLGGVLCPLNVDCHETQCNPRIIRSVINRFSGFIGDINSPNDVSSAITAIMRDVISASSTYRLRYRAISSSVSATLPRNGVTVGSCPLKVPRSLNNGFDFDVARNTIVFYGNCRPVNLTANEFVVVNYSYWSRTVNCSQYTNSSTCNPAQCRWCPTAGSSGLCVSSLVPCAAPLVAGPVIYGGFGAGNNGGYGSSSGAGIPWWAILLLILFCCCLLCLCLLLALLAFLALKRSPKSGKKNAQKYEMLSNPGAKQGAYSPPADDFGAAPYASPSGSGGSGAGAGAAGGMGGAGATGGEAPSGGVAGSGVSDGRSGLKGHGGRPMTMDTGISQADQGDPNIKPDDNKYILFGGQPKWPG